MIVHGVEYAFGAHDYPTSGVFEVEPRQCPGFKFRKSIFIGMTCLDTKEVREFMERHAASYNGDTYHLIVKNCNHFCKDVCHKLTAKKIPNWVNRLAKIGMVFLVHTTCKYNAQYLWVYSSKFLTFYLKTSLFAGSACNCVLPETLKINVVQEDTSLVTYDSDKKRLKNAFSCLSSISMRQKQLSASSLFLCSPLKSCLPSCELKSSKKRSLTER